MRRDSTDLYFPIFGGPYCDIRFRAFAVSDGGFHFHFGRVRVVLGLMRVRASAARFRRSLEFVVRLWPYCSDHPPALW